MSSTFFGLETARRAMSAQRMAMDVVNHNVSNTNTPGYRRQRVSMTAAPPAPGSMQPGTGVLTSGIERMRDQFVDAQIRHTSASLGLWESRNQVLEEMQEVFKEPSDIGLSASMDHFWQAWNELSLVASDPGRRTSVQQQGASLTSALNLASLQLREMQDDVKNNIDSLFARVNAAGAGIAAINKEIVRAKVAGENVADLLDKRDLLVDELSADVDVAVVELENGEVNVSVGGKILVSSSESRTLDTSVQVSAGRISGLQEAKNDLIPKYMKQLDDLANGIMAKVNEIHRSGYDLDGNPGVDFFVGSGAQDIKVNPEVAGNLARIAAADEKGQPGNGKNALKLAQLKDARVAADGSSSFSDVYGALLISLGLDAREAKRSVDVYDGVLEQQWTRRESVSGVAIDEELLSLIKYQSAFDAAARLVNTMDEMLDRLINGTGLVGRR